MVIQTGSQTVGPFFHYGLIHEGENNLVTPNTVGERIYITGQVLDGDSDPVTDAMIEIWQADAQGHFNHPTDANQTKADPFFRYFGRADTINNGIFQFKTIKPAAIMPTVAPYVNVRVFARGLLIHAVTRIYFSDETNNTSDPILITIDSDRRQTLIAQREESADLPTYRFNIILQGTGETVFFDV